MTPSMMGALAGAAMGLVAAAIMRRLAHHIQHENKEPNARRIATILRGAALVDLLVFTVIGYFIGPLLFDGN
jgi:hypothetical protein